MLLLAAAAVAFLVMRRPAAAPVPGRATNPDAPPDLADAGANRAGALPFHLIPDAPTGSSDPLASSSSAAGAITPGVAADLGVPTGRAAGGAERNPRVLPLTLESETIAVSIAPVVVSPKGVVSR